MVFFGSCEHCPSHTAASRMQLSRRLPVPPSLLYISVSVDDVALVCRRGGWGGWGFADRFLLAVVSSASAAVCVRVSLCRDSVCLASCHRIVPM